MREFPIHSNVDYKGVELSSLQEITLAINNNLPEESLYKIFYFTLKANLKINKFVVYALDHDWQCALQYGVHTDFRTKSLPNDIRHSNSIVYFFNYKGQDQEFSEFDICIPVTHKNKVRAYIFLGWPEKTDIFFPDIVPFLRTVSNIIQVAIENKKLAKNEIEQEKLKKELEIARTVQTHLFPKKLPQTDKLNIAATYLPHQSVGGDYYDFIQVNENQFYVCIADVSGKGIPAAILMSNFQASLRTMIRMGLNLKKIIEELNIQIYENTQDGTFITFFIALIDLEKNKLNYVNAGHNPPLIISGKNSFTELEMGTTILGPIKNLPFVNEGSIEIHAGSTLFLYTDGLAETENRNMSAFGTIFIEEQLIKSRLLSAEEINRDMVACVDKFREGNPFSDDITLLTCKVK